MRLDIDSGCKTILKYLRNPFQAIYIIILADIGRCIKIRISGQNRDFGDFHVFLTSHHMAYHVAGNAQK